MTKGQTHFVKVNGFKKHILKTLTDLSFKIQRVFEISEVSLER